MASAEDYKAEISRHIDGLLSAVGDFIAEHVNKVDTAPETTGNAATGGAVVVTEAASTGGAVVVTEAAPVDPAPVDAAPEAPAAPPGANTAQQDFALPAPAEDPTPAEEVSDEPSSSTSSDVTPPDTSGL